MTDGQTDAAATVTEDQQAAEPSPRPWRKGNCCGSLICDIPRRLSNEPPSDMATLDTYGGRLVCESLREVDADLILACVNEPEEKAPTDPLAEFVALETERLALEDRLKVFKREAAVLSDWLIEDWADRGQSNARVNGRTVFIAQEFFCSKAAGVATDAVCDSLERNGLGSLVNPAYAPASLKAWVRERDDAGETIPEDLKTLLNYDTVPRMRSRKS